MTKTNRIGLVMTIAIPEVVRHINAFTNGVRSVNPNAKVIVKWVGNWFDPKVEPVLTKELLEANTDIIHSHTDTTIPLEVVENAGGEPLKTKDGDDVYTIAYNASNGCDFGPRTCLTSVHWNWGPILKRMVDKVKEGKWDPKEVVWEQVSANQSNSSFSLSTMSKKVPSEVRIDAETLLGKLAKTGVEGQQLPFVGPQVDNTGKERLAKGKQFTDQDLLNMCWFVEGVYNDDATTPAKVPSECRGDR
jgi:basic membrane protein A